jgi:hypothetical protein
MMVGHQTDCLGNVLKELGKVMRIGRIPGSMLHKVRESGIKGKQCLWG